MFGLTQHIKGHTRIIDNSAAIELVLVSDQDRVTQSGVLLCGSEKGFEENLISQVWFSVINCENTNNAWRILSGLFKKVLFII